MKWLKRLAWLAAGIALAGFSALLLIDNATPVQLRLLAWETPPAPVFLWLLAAFAAGALASFCLGALTRLRHRATERKLRRELRANQSEPAPAGALEAPPRQET